MQDLTRERDSLQQSLWNLRRQIEQERADLQATQQYHAGLGVSGWRGREEKIKAYYEQQTALLETELARERGEKVAPVATTPNALAPREDRSEPGTDPQGTDEELLKDYWQTPEGQRWTQGETAHG